MSKAARLQALHSLASAASARVILAAADNVEAKHSTLFPDLTRESRKVIAKQMRLTAAQVDCESTRFEDAKVALADETDAVRRARAGVDPQRTAHFPADLTEGQDGD